MRNMSPGRCGWILSSILPAVLTLTSLPSAICQSSKAKVISDNTTVQANAIPRPQPTQFVNDYASRDSLKWSEFQKALELDPLPTDGSIPGCVAESPKSDRAYVFHVVHWGKDFSVVSSSWAAYSARKVSNGDATLVRELSATGDPLIYGKQSILFVGINYSDSVTALQTISFNYKLSVTQGTPKNVQDLSQVLTTLLGVTAPAAKSAGPPARIAFACLTGTNRLPYSINVVETVVRSQPASNNPDETPKNQGVTEPSSDGTFPIAPHKAEAIYFRRAKASSPLQISLQAAVTNTTGATPAPGADSASQGNGNSKQGGKAGGTGNASQTASKTSDSSTPTAGLIDCTSLSKSLKTEPADANNTNTPSQSTTCTISRTFQSLDKEWWDVSLGVAIPGVRETKYSLSGTSLISKPTTHTDIYAFVDLIPTSYYSPTSSVPHFILGVPTASQPLYRPMFGLSEDLTGWTGLQRHGFPLAMSFFAGTVWMKTTVVSGTPTTAAALTADSSTKRVWKPIFGIELPVASLISKIGKGSAKSSTSKTTSSATNQGSSTPATP